MGSIQAGVKVGAAAVPGRVLLEARLLAGILPDISKNL